jgi:hypothetical protein
LMDLFLSNQNWGASIERLLRTKPPQLRVILDGPLQTDTLGVMTLYAAISSFVVDLEIVRLSDSHYYDAERTYSDTLFTALFLHGVQSSEGGLPLAPMRIEPGRFCVPTSAIVAPDYDVFRRTLATLFLQAHIKLPPELFGLVSRLLFEMSLNAEEHGGYRIPQQSPPAVVPRHIGVVHHTATLRYVGGNAAEYFRKYLSVFSKPEGGWLEIVVGDGGMGIAFPSYFVETQGSKGSGEDIYGKSHTFEISRLNRLLRQGISTKGSWGRQISTQTRPGMGTEVIRQQFGAARAFATVRTGRSIIHSDYRDDVGVASWDGSPTYAVSTDPLPCFLGTTWQLLVPVTSLLQFQL